MLSRLSVRQMAIVGGSVLTLGFAGGLFSDPDGLSLWFSLGDDVARLEVQNAEKRGEIEALRRRVQALKSDSHAIERAARESGYIHTDELLFELR